MKINCIAIEDEPLALKKIKEFIGQVEYLNLLGGFDNALHAIGFMKNNPVDLIFLDIRMKKLSGIEFLESISKKPKVIITSAYDEYALKGYELEVADYLLKPYTFTRFLKAVEKVENELARTAPEPSPEYIFVKTEHRFEKVALEQVLYIQGMKDYLQIYMPHKKLMTLQSFKNLSHVLPNREFVRVHNSYMVSLSKIESIERNRIKIGNALIPISESYKNAFYSLLQEKKYLM